MAAATVATMAAATASVSVAGSFYQHKITTFTGGYFIWRVIGVFGFRTSYKIRLFLL